MRLPSLAVVALATFAFTTGSQAQDNTSFPPPTAEHRSPIPPATMSSATLAREV